MSLKKQTKRELLFINVIIILVGLLFASLFYFIYKDRQSAQSFISDKEVIDLGFKVQLYPRNIKDMYNIYMNDDKLNKWEYNQIQSAIRSYEEQKTHQLSKKSSRTELEEAVANLKAYDDIGYEIVAPELRVAVREKLVQKVEKLREKNQK